VPTGGVRSALAAPARSGAGASGRQAEASARSRRLATCLPPAVTLRSWPLHFSTAARPRRVSGRRTVRVWPARRKRTVRRATTARPRFATTGTRPFSSDVTCTRSTPERNTARWLVSTTCGFAASAA
jgi:hypothetical protein